MQRQLWAMVVASAAAIACGGSESGDAGQGGATSANATASSVSVGSGGAGGACVPKTCDETPYCSGMADLGCFHVEECGGGCGDPAGHFRQCQVNANDPSQGICGCYADTQSGDQALCQNGETPHFCGPMTALGKVSNCHDIGVQRKHPVTGETTDVWCCSNI